MLDEQLKAGINDLVKQIAEVFHISLPIGIVQNSVLSQYDKGLDLIGSQLNMNFTRDPARLETLQGYVLDNIKDLSEEVSNKLRKEIVQGVVNLESTAKVQERIKKVTDMATDRARMIARTELNRAENVGHIDGARQSDLKLMKRWDAHLDKRTSAVCTDLDGQTIPLNSKFKWQGKEFDAPPAHPNCRSTLVFVQKDN